MRCWPASFNRWKACLGGTHRHTTTISVRVGEVERESEREIEEEREIPFIDKIIVQLLSAGVSTTPIVHRCIKPNQHSRGGNILVP